MKLNLGCGYKKLNGYINIDVSTEVNPDYVMDLDNPKWKKEWKGKIEYVLLDNVLEHLEKPIKLLESIKEIRKKGCIIDIRVPYHYEKSDTFHHKIAGFHEKSFRKFYTDTQRPYYSKLQLKPIKIKKIPYDYAKKIPFKKYLDRFLTGIYREIRYEMEIL